VPRSPTTGAAAFAATACPRCERPLRLSESHRLRVVRCPGCGASLSLAEMVAPPAVPPPAAAEASPGKERSAPPAAAAEANPSRLVRLAMPAPALLAAGIPLWTRGGLPGTGLAAGLGLAGLVLGLWCRWRPGVRLLLTLALMGLGYGIAFAVLVPDDSDSGPPPDLPANWPMLSPPFSPPGGVAGLPVRQPAHPPSPTDLTVLTHIGNLLAIAVDPEARAAFVTRADGSLDRYSYPDFRRQGTYRLEQPGYRAVLDDRHGRLFVAVSDREALHVNRYGDRPVGRGDLHVYDVRSLPADQDLTLRPVGVVPLGGDVSRLLASPDRSCLYYLLHRPDGDVVGRLSLVADAPGSPPEVRWRADGTITALALSPDGAALYAAGPGVVRVFEPRTLEERRRIAVEPTAFDLAADNAGRLFVSEAGQWTSITVVDARHDGAVLGRWNPRLHGLVYLQLTPDATRLYVGSSSLVSNSLHGWQVQKPTGGLPPQFSNALGDGTGPVRGEFFITPDGRHLVNRYGKVFQVAGPPAGPRPHLPGRLFGS
jgi:hypothetical protein